MTVSIPEEKLCPHQAQKLVEENLLILLEENKDDKTDEISNPAYQTHSEDSHPIFFK